MLDGSSCSYITQRNVQECISFLSPLPTLVIFTRLAHTDDVICSFIIMVIIIIIIIRLSIFSNVSIYLVIKYLLSIYYVPSTRPGTRYTGETKQQAPCTHGTKSLVKWFPDFRV